MSLPLDESPTRKTRPDFRRVPITWSAELFRSIADRAEAEGVTFSEAVRRICQSAVSAAAEGRGETAEARP